MQAVMAAAPDIDSSLFTLVGKARLNLLPQGVAFHLEAPLSDRARLA